jgi:lipoprotein NlpI
LATVYLGDMDAGIADMRRAIALKSTDYHYFTKLMRAQLANGNLPGAVDALGRAVQIDPTMWDGAGVLVDYLSDSREKLEDLLAQGVEREPDFPFWDFWKGMLQKKAGDEVGAKAMFAAGRKQIKDAPWLAALFDYAGGGSISPRELRAQARSDNPRFQAEHLTIVNYFIGEVAMIAGKRDAARDAWQRAVDGHVYYLAEYGAAKVRLAQAAGQ